MDVYLILLQWRCCAEGLWMHMPSVQTAKSDLVSQPLLLTGSLRTQDHHQLSSYECDVVQTVVLAASLPHESANAALARSA